MGTETRTVKVEKDVKTCDRCSATARPCWTYYEKWTPDVEKIGEVSYVECEDKQELCTKCLQVRTGSRAMRKVQKREKRDFDADYLGAQYLAPEGWNGIPAGSFRTAMISACRLCGFKMTIAKLSVFIEADGYDAETSCEG